MELFVDEAFEDDPIEPATPGTMDGQDFDGDSEVGSLASSGFTSLNTKVLQHTYEGGRRYQSYVEDRYPIPNDEREREREEWKHDLLKSMFEDRLFQAPIGESPHKILDLGTGAGLWAIAVAEQFPAATVIGVDLSPIQPNYVPPNIDWRVDDIERSWPALFSGADFIHLRSIVNTLTNPPHVFASSFEALKHGAWLEVSDVLPILRSDDNTIPEDYPVARFYRLLGGPTFAAKYKWKLDLADKLPDHLQAAGFVNVHQLRRRLPIGRWAKQSKQRLIGIWYAEILIEFITAVLVKYRDLGLTEEEAVRLEEDCKKCMHDTSIHAYMGWIVVWGQRP